MDEGEGEGEVEVLALSKVNMGGAKMQQLLLLLPVEGVEEGREMSLLGGKATKKVSLIPRTLTTMVPHRTTKTNISRYSTNLWREILGEC